MPAPLPLSTPDPPAAPADRREVAAPDEAAGERLDRLLATALAPLSRARLQGLIAEGRVSSGGRTIRDAAHRVKPGQRFTVEVPAPAPARPEPQAMALVLVYEDAALLVVDKPAGLVVHPGAGNPDRTLVNALLAHCGASLSGIGGVARPGIVHRLDRDTSGLMVVAKTDAAHAALSAQFADRTLSRDYLAVARGVPRPAEGAVALPIGRDPAHRRRMAARREGGKPARTRYRVLRRFGDGAASLVACKLETGRTHQIRVHLSAIGHPLLGDRLYGGPAMGPLGFERQALHAAHLRFRHPATGLPMAFNSALPADLAGLVARLESFEKAIPE